MYKAEYILFYEMIVFILYLSIVTVRLDLRLKLPEGTLQSVLVKFTDDIIDTFRSKRRRTLSS